MVLKVFCKVKSAGVLVRLTNEDIYAYTYTNPLPYEMLKKVAIHA